MSKTFRPWTTAETDLARKLVKTDITERQFLARVGRTLGAAKSRLKYVDNPAFRAGHIARGIAKRRATAKSGLVVIPKVHCPPEVLADAERRAMAPRSLTASISTGSK